MADGLTGTRYDRSRSTLREFAVGVAALENRHGVLLGGLGRPLFLLLVVAEEVLQEVAVVEQIEEGEPRDGVEEPEPEASDGGEEGSGGTMVACVNTEVWTTRLSTNSRHR